MDYRRGTQLFSHERQFSYVLLRSQHGILEKLAHHARNEPPHVHQHHMGLRDLRSRAVSAVDPSEG